MSKDRTSKTIHPWVSVQKHPRVHNRWRLIIGVGDGKDASTEVLWESRNQEKIRDLALVVLATTAAVRKFEREADVEPGKTE